MTNSNLEKGKDFFQLVVYSSSLREVRTGMKAGTRPQWNSAYWLALQSHIQIDTFLSAPSVDHLPMCGTAHNVLGLPTLIINQEHALQTCLQGRLMDPFSQLRLLFPDNASYCLSDKKTKHRGRLWEKLTLFYLVKSLLSYTEQLSGSWSRTKDSPQRRNLLGVGRSGHYANIRKRCIFEEEILVLRQN